VFAVGLIEEFFVNRAVNHHCAGHIPVGHDHAEVSAVLAHHDFHDVLDAGGIESEQPVARFAHNRFPAQVVKLQNQICIFMFTHFVLLLVW